MAVTYIICAAGEGSRFQKDFGILPKACINLHGIPLLDWSLRSLPIFADDTIVFITQKKHKIRKKLISRIKNQYIFNNVEWIELDKITSGQLETAYFAKQFSPKGNSIVIFNCDTYFQSKSLVQYMNDPLVDGIISCAEAEGSSWSFCQIDSLGRVIDVREKERISDWASVGLYYFRDSEHFFNCAKKQLNNIIDCNEYYVAPLYQLYIAEGKNIIMDKVSLFKPMGTPEQIEEFWQIPIEQVRLENNKPVLVMDLDNTITIEDSKVAYPDKEPNLPIIKKLQECHEAGWEIIIHSARRMETHKNEEAKVIADIGKITIDWLEKHNVPYDGLRFGKPYARNGYYVDDKAMLPEDFLKMDVRI